jgi:hypothetical protein
MGVVHCSGVLEKALDSGRIEQTTARNRAFVFGGNGSSFLEEFLERPTNRLHICMLQGQNFPCLTLENLYFGEEIG